MYDFDNQEHVLKYFAYAHSKSENQHVSKACCQLARDMALILPNGPELTVGLRKLLEAKDCFVRANLAEISSK